jgi:hypothetical protein
MEKAYKGTLKLTIELVPQTLWYINLRKSMGKTKWDVLRKNIYAEYHYACGICGAKDVSLNCHERWEYEVNRNQGIQRLLGFIALCPMCHHCKHIGLAGILAQRGELNFDDVIAHFMKVNDCTRQKYEDHSQEQWTVWAMHSNKSMQWTFDYGEYSEFAPKQKETPSPKRIASNETDNRNPMDVTNDFWLRAFRRNKASKTEKSQYTGKWMIFVDQNHINNAWKTVKCATEDGLLGHTAKVATAKPNENAQNERMKLICVYTEDYRDEEDLLRVLATLRTRLGFNERLNYKADKATKEGVYSFNSEGPVSLFTAPPGKIELRVPGEKIPKRKAVCQWCGSEAPFQSIDNTNLDLPYCSRCLKDADGREITECGRCGEFMYSDNGTLACSSCWEDIMAE